MSAMKCKACGCTDDDCRGCIQRTGSPCAWAEPGLCTACTGSTLIALERQRQLEEEGFDGKHDASHVNGEIAAAAISYAMTPLMRQALRRAHGRGADDRLTWKIQSLLDFFWPWERKWWRPSPRDRVRELVKAGALIAGEIDRLQRTKKGGRS